MELWTDWSTIDKLPPNRTTCNPNIAKAKTHYFVRLFTEFEVFGLFCSLKINCNIIATITHFKPKWSLLYSSSPFIGNHLFWALSSNEQNIFKVNTKVYLINKVGQISFLLRTWIFTREVADLRSAFISNGYPLCDSWSRVKQVKKGCPHKKSFLFSVEITSVKFSKSKNFQLKFVVPIRHLVTSLKGEP